MKVQRIVKILRESDLAEVSQARAAVVFEGEEGVYVSRNSDRRQVTSVWFIAKQDVELGEVLFDSNNLVASESVRAQEVAVTSGLIQSVLGSNVAKLTVEFK